MKNPWTMFFDWYKAWIKDVVTTNHIIATGVALSVVYVFWALLADSLGHPLQELTIRTIGLFITGMLAGGVAQFGIKRHTDKDTKVAVAAARGTVAMPAVKDPS